MTDIIHQLIGRRGEIADQLRKLETSLVHLDATIELFQPDYKPVPVKRGDITRVMLDVLREATQPMTTPEVAERIGSSVKRTGIALCGQRKRGVVRSERTGKCTAWEMVR
jgi:hypothetical protein